MPRVQVQVGDVIYIEANSGSVKRVGRCDTYSSEYDLEARPVARVPRFRRLIISPQAEEYVPLPKGDVHKKKEIVQVCTHIALGHLRAHLAPRSGRNLARPRRCKRQTTGRPGPHVRGWANDQV